MNLQDSDHIRQAFDYFCKKVLKYKARDYDAKQKRRGEHEVTFSELSKRELAGLAAVDKYFADEHVFSVNDQSINLTDSDLAEALKELPPDRREIVLLSYFFDMTDMEIGKQMNLVRRTVAYRRTSSLQELKQILEVSPDE